MLFATYRSHCPLVMLQVELADLPLLTDADLKDMGVKALGPRRRMLAAFALLGKVTAEGGGGSGDAGGITVPVPSSSAAGEGHTSPAAAEEAKEAATRPAMLQRLRRFYEQYHPSRLVPTSENADVNLDLEVILDQWAGREEELFVALERKYCASASASV